MSTSPASLAEEFLPVYDVSDAVAVVVAADVDTTWRALPDIASQILHGETPSAPLSVRLLDEGRTLLSGHGGLLDVVRDDAEATR